MDMIELLKSGETTAEELLEQFTTQLREAQEAIQKEKMAKQEQEQERYTLDEAREEMVIAIIDYLLTLGVITDADLTDNTVQENVAAVKAMEKNVVSYKQALKTLESLNSEQDFAKQKGNQCHCSIKNNALMDEDKILEKFLAQIV